MQATLPSDLYLFKNRKKLSFVTHRYGIDFRKIHKNNYHNSPLERGWGVCHEKNPIIFVNFPTN